jgi:hypothetical protein
MKVGLHDHEKKKHPNVTDWDKSKFHGWANGGKTSYPLHIKKKVTTPRCKICGQFKPFNGMCNDCDDIDW